MCQKTCHFFKWQVQSCSVDIISYLIPYVSLTVTVKVNCPGWIGTAAASAAMAPPVLLCNRMLSPAPALFAGVLAGALVFPAVLRLTSFFKPEDRERFDHLLRGVPGAVQAPVRSLLDLLMPVTEIEVGA